jgi:hypothetical protein
VTPQSEGDASPPPLRYGHGLGWLSKPPSPEHPMPALGLRRGRVFHFGLCSFAYRKRKGSGSREGREAASSFVDRVGDAIGRPRRRRTNMRSSLA